MSKRKQRPQRTAFDEPSAVEQIVQGAQQRQREEARHDGRGVPGNAGKLGVDKEGKAKMTIYLSPEHQALIRGMGEQEDVLLRSLVELAVVGLYDAWKRGKVDLESMKEYARSMKATYKLEIPEDFSFFSE